MDSDKHSFKTDGKQVSSIAVVQGFCAMPAAPCRNPHSCSLLCCYLSWPPMYVKVLIYVKSPVCKVTCMCKVKDSNISKDTNPGFLNAQTITQYLNCPPLFCSPTFTNIQSFLFHIQETNVALGRSCCTDGQCPGFTVKFSSFIRSK